MHARKNAGHRQRVRDVRLPTTTGLTVVGLLGVIVGTPYLLSLIQRQVVCDQLLKRGQRTIGKLARSRCRGCISRPARGYAGEGPAKRLECCCHHRQRDRGLEQGCLEAGRQLLFCFDFAFACQDFGSD